VNKLTKLAKLVRFKRMLIFCLDDWEEPAPCLYHSANHFNHLNTVGCGYATYVVKSRSHTLAVYINEFILGSARVRLSSEMIN